MGSSFVYYYPAKHTMSLFFKQLQNKNNTNKDQLSGEQE